MLQNVWERDGCMVSTFCPWCLFGKTANRLDNTCVQSVLCCVGCTPVAGFVIARQSDKIRRKYGIDQGTGPTCATACLCAYE